MTDKFGMPMVESTADEIERLRAELASCRKSQKEFMEDAAAATIRAAKAEAELAAIKGQIADPSWVCLEGMSASEFAAFDYGSKCCMDALRRILDGEDKGVGTCNEPWEALRRKVLALAAIKGQEPDRFESLELMLQGAIAHADVFGNGNVATSVVKKFIAMAKGE